MNTGSTNVGAVIRRLRQDQNLRLREIAAACGVQVSAVSKWERGAVPVPIEQLANLSKVLRVDLTIRAERPAPDPGEVEELAELAKNLDKEQLSALLALARALVKK